MLTKFYKTSHRSTVRNYFYTFPIFQPRDGASRIEYVRQLPYFANESCDSVRGMIPVVPCPNSACIKLIMLKTFKHRQICGTRFFFKNEISQLESAPQMKADFSKIEFKPILLHFFQRIRVRHLKFMR